MVSRFKQTKKKKNEMNSALKRKLKNILELNLEKLLQDFGEEYCKTCNGSYWV